MAEVFVATRSGHASFEKEVVIKRLHPFLGRSAKLIKMFEAEARLAGQIEHRNIVQTFDFGALPSGEIYIAMEYVRGVDLRRLLQRSVSNKVELPIWFSLHLLIEVLEALAYIHELEDSAGRSRNIIHRDVTPSNIFLSRHGYPKLGDFGVAHDEARTTFTRTGALKGKIAYMPPEQLKGERLDHRTDLFAAGVVLWECLTHRRLFGGRPELETMNLICQGPRSPPSRYNSACPKALDEIVLKAVSIERDDRYESAWTFQRALLSVLADKKRGVSGAEVREVVRMISGEGEKDPGPPLDEAFTGGAPTCSDPGGPPRAGEVTWSSADPATDPSTNPSSGVSSAPLRYRSESEMGLELPIAEPYPSARSSASISALGITRLADLAPPEADIDALVHEAVQAVEAAQPPDTDEVPIPESSLLHGLERGPMDVRQSSWVARALQDARHEGPHAFWVQEEAHELGPYSWAQVYTVAQMAPRMGSSILISADRAQWMDVPTIAQLVGAELLLEEGVEGVESVERGPICGDLTQRSLTALFGSLHHQRASGTLIVTRAQGSREARRTLHIWEGAPTHVGGNSEALQLFELLIEQALISREMLPSIMHEVISAQRSIIDVVSRRSGMDVSGYRPVFMRRRLLDLFSWRDGQYVFTPSEAVHPEPFARSLLSVLPELIYKSFEREALRVQLMPVMELRMGRSERFGEEVARMELNGEQQEVVELLGEGKRLSGVLKRFAQDERSLLCFAYLFMETGLLLFA